VRGKNKNLVSASPDNIQGKVLAARKAVFSLPIDSL